MSIRRWIPGHVGGESETILGKWFASSGKRDRVIIATKVGMDMGDGKQGLAPKYIEQAVEASLAQAPDRPHRSLSIAQG